MNVNMEMLLEDGNELKCLLNTNVDHLQRLK